MFLDNRIGSVPRPCPVRFMGGLKPIETDRAHRLGRTRPNLLMSTQETLPRQKRVTLITKSLSTSSDIHAARGTTTRLEARHFGPARTHRQSSIMKCIQSRGVPEWWSLASWHFRSSCYEPCTTRLTSLQWITICANESKNTSKVKKKT
jgi:hypothetical protein